MITPRKRNPLIDECIREELRVKEAKRVEEAELRHQYYHQQALDSAAELKAEHARRTPTEKVLHNLVIFLFFHIPTATYHAREWVKEALGSKS